MSTRAAVIVIDNKYGFAGFDAATMNDIGNEVFRGLLKPRYNDIIVITAHEQSPENNKLVQTLKEASSKSESVDMYVFMHTNMDDAKLADVSVRAFIEGLSDTERAHLRFLYNMGCGDGNAVSFIEAQLIGFRTFVGHKGTPSASPLFAYPALKNWVLGGHKISESSKTTYDTIKKCMPLAGQKLIEFYKTSMEDGRRAIEKCFPKDMPKNYDITTPLVDMLPCFEQNAPETVARVAGMLNDITQCMPDITDFADKHSCLISRLKDKIPCSAIEILGAGLYERQLPEIIDKIIKSTEPIVYGANIAFNDEPPVQKLRKEDIVSRIVNIINAPNRWESRQASNLLVHLYSKEILTDPEFLKTVNDADAVLEIRKSAIFELVDREPKTAAAVFEKIVCDLRGDRDVRDYLFVRLGMLDATDSTVAIDIFKGVSKNCGEPALKLASYMFLRDAEAITDAEFEAATGKKRKDCPEEWGNYMHYLQDPSLFK